MNEINKASKRNPQGQIPPYDFLGIVDKECGERFTEQIELKRYLNNMTLYLAEVESDMITPQRLNLALDRNDANPLPQKLV